MPAIRPKGGEESHLFPDDSLKTFCCLFTGLYISQIGYMEVLGLWSRESILKLDSPALFDCQAQ